MLIFSVFFVLSPNIRIIDLVRRLFCYLNATFKLKSMADTEFHYKVDTFAWIFFIGRSLRELVFKLIVSLLQLIKGNKQEFGPIKKVTKVWINIYHSH